MKLNQFQKFFILIIGVFLGVGIFLKLVVGNSSNFIGYDALTMLKFALIDSPSKTILNWTSDFANLTSVQDENDQLRYEMSKNPSYKAAYFDAKQKNRELSLALKIQDEDQRFTRTWANVISRDQTTWNNIITIDKGSHHGVKENLAVTSVNGLIGKVVGVSKYSSTVKLLTSEDKQNSVSIKILVDKEAASMGVLQNYDVNKERYVLMLFDESVQVKKGMQVVTSGNGGVYPSGLLIGQVETIEALNNQTGLTIYVKPVEDFQTFAYTSIILSQRDAS